MMQLRLNREAHDTLTCEECSTSAFHLFAGTEGKLARVECVNCGHGFTLSMVEPDPQRLELVFASHGPSPAEIRRIRESFGALKPVSATAGIDAVLAARTPYENGRYAYLDRKTIDDNPYGKVGISHLQWARGWKAMSEAALGFPEADRYCHASRDGECNWDQCPQIRDGESAATGRHCPLDMHPEEQ